MTIYKFNELKSNSIITFSIASDILQFDTTFSAASGSVAQTGANISLTYGSKTIQLANISLAQLSTTSIKFADGSLLLIGDNSSNSANDALENVLSGSALNDLLVGLGGNDTLDGKAGADAMVGGTGDDTYVVDNANDRVSEANGTFEGVDTIRFNPADPATLTTYILPVNLENLQLLGSANINGTGNAVNNVITGNGGNNILNGMVGADIMEGGNGNDIYIVDNNNDQVIETNTSTTQIDTVRTSINYAIANYPYVGASGTQSYLLQANVENLELTGTVKQNGLGNELDNTITGNAFDNILDGGKGGDTLIGGDGNDIYVVDSITDKVTETNAATSQIDTIQAFTSYVIPVNVENLQLLGTGNLNGTGNALNNIFYVNPGNNSLNGGAGNDTVSYQTSPFPNTGTDFGAFMGVTIDLRITTEQVTGGSGFDTLVNIENVIGTVYSDTLTGNSQANILNGGGGIDVLIGGDGDDTYVVDGGDAVIETNSRGGTDTVQASADFILSDNIENLLLLAGTTNINGRGNSLSNAITGNGGSNQLSGDDGADVLIGNAGDDLLNGGQGADNMQGGAGNDTYIVDHVGDVVDESIGAAGAGTDLVRSDINYTLPDGVDNLHLLGLLDLSGIGNNLSNTIYANLGNNNLDGLSGIDTVSYQFGASAGVIINLTTSQATGGSGADTLLNFENAIGSSYDDTIFATNIGNVLNGGGGTDTVSYQSGVFAGVTINLSLTTVQNTGGSGADTLSNFENAIGSGFNDIITGTTGNNLLDGRAGTDTISYQSGATAGVTINLSLATAQKTGGSGTDTVLNFENAIGSGFNDTIIGTTGDNALDGGAGTDTVSYQSGATAGVAINLSLATAQATGGSGTDTLLNFENAIGSGFNDIITGTTGNNILDGGAGTDTVSYQSGATAGVTINLNLTAQNIGGSGTDTLLNFENVVGSNFDDTLIGNSQSNVLTGSLGKDVMTGGLGADKFAFNNLQDSTNAAPDTIKDFSHAQADKIDVSSVYSGIFRFLGTGAFTKAAGQLHYSVSSGNAIVSGDVDGNGTADFTIHLTGVTSLVAADLIL